MVNNSSKLNNLCFDTLIITFPSKEKGEFDQPNSLDLSLPITYNRYLMKLSVVKSIHFPFVESHNQTYMKTEQFQNTPPFRADPFFLIRCESVFVTM